MFQMKKNFYEKTATYLSHSVGTCITIGMLSLESGIHFLSSSSQDDYKVKKSKLFKLLHENSSRNYRLP